MAIQKFRVMLQLEFKADESLVRNREVAEYIDNELNSRRVTVSRIEVVEVKPHLSDAQTTIGRS